jgi:hypothetical protein
VAITFTVESPISSPPPPVVGPGVIRRIAALPSDIDGRSSFTFQINWIEDVPVDFGFLVTWEEIAGGGVFLFPINWVEAGVVFLFVVAWTEEPEGVDDAYERDPQIIYALMTKP